MTQEATEPLRLRGADGPTDPFDVPDEPGTAPQLSLRMKVGLEDMRHRLELGPQQMPRLGRDDRYEVRACLGRGGMGEVYLAHDRVLDREVALKVVAARYRHSRQLRIRLLREARSLARLHHPNVLEVYDVDTTSSGELVVSIALVKGTTLAQWQVGQSLSALLDKYLAAGRGLAAAHFAGIVHRDFKPANVLIGEPDERIVVADFGLAGELRSSAIDPSECNHDQLTGESLLGTFAFMAPELLAGQVGTPATDQYAFGVALWQASCGQLPFATHARTRVPERPRGMPRWLYRVLARALAPDPTHRHSGMQDVLDALERGRARPKIALVTLGLGLVVGLLAAGWSMRAAPSCTLLHSSWSDAHAARILELPGGRHASEVFAASAAALAERAERACSAPSPSSEALGERLCLERWRDELDRRIAAFELDPDLALLDLRAYEACSPKGPVLARPVREHLAAAEVHRFELEHEAGLAEVDAALALAPTHTTGCLEGTSPERAAALLERSQLESSRSNFVAARLAIAGARDELHGCSELGELGELWVRVNIVHAKLLALDLEQPEAAALVLDGSDVTLRRLGTSGTSYLDEQLAITAGFIALRSDQPDLAIAHFERALAMLGEQPGEQLEHAKLLIDIAGAHQQAGRSDAALRAYASAERIVEDRLGADHPHTLAYRGHLALGRLIAGDTRDVEAHERLVAELDDPAQRAALHHALSRHFTDLDPERALTHAWALAAELEQLPDLAPREQAGMLTEAGQMLAHADPTRSVAMLERALGLWQDLGARDEFDLAELCLAQAHLELGRTHVAEVHALALLERAPADPLVRELAQELVDQVSGSKTRSRN